MALRPSAHAQTVLALSDRCWQLQIVRGTLRCIRVAGPAIMQAAPLAIDGLESALLLVSDDRLRIATLDRGARLCVQKGHLNMVRLA